MKLVNTAILVEVAIGESLGGRKLDFGKHLSVAECPLHNLEMSIRDLG
jgi:hypothetical protein